MKLIATAHESNTHGAFSGANMIGIHTLCVAAEAGYLLHHQAAATAHLIKDQSAEIARAPLGR